jgi:hypothetical protein
MIANLKRYAMRRINLKWSDSTTLKTNNMAQQTAVNWLLSELQIRLLKIKSEPDGIVREKMINSFLIDAEQAEAMEEEQIVESWHNGYANQSPMIDEANCGQTYYNETYGGMSGKF